MSTKAYGSITVTDLLDTATYIYYSTTGSNTAVDWYITPTASDKYIGIYSGPPEEGGQPTNPTTNILSNLNISKYVGDTGATIWTTATAPSSPNYTFTISNLIGQTGRTPQVGDIIVYSYYRYTITSVDSATVLAGIRTSIRGASGTSSQWYYGTGITGTSTTATIYSNSGVSSAVVGDMYLNTETSNYYKCTTAGNASTAKWVYAGNLTDSVINNIEIGSRNYIRNSQAIILNQFPYLNSTATEYTTVYNNIATVYCSGSKYIQIDTDILKSGEEYTISFEVTRQDAQKVFLIIDNNIYDLGNTSSNEGEWKRFSKTITLQNDVSYFRLQIYDTNSPDTYTAAWRYMQLEKGNKATDWSLAPEDIQERIDNTILNVTPLYYVTGLFSKQVTGTSIHITDADDKNALEHLTITIPTPTQEGSGTASPTNNRPLIGWNRGNLYVSSTLNTTDVTIPVVFTDSLYGGKIDIISGQRIKTHQYLELDGSLDEEWIIEDKGTSNQRFMMRLAAPAKTAGQQLSNKFIYTSTSSNQSWGKMNLGIDAIFYDSNQEFVDDENAEQILNFVTAQDKFRTWLQQNPVQLYYQLAAELTAILDPIENVFLLSDSENYIWFDQNLNMEIEYLTAPNTPNSPNEHVQNFNLNYNEWTTMIPKHDINYPYHYICYEYFHSNGTYTWSDVILDEAITGTIKDFRKKTNNLGYLLASTNAKYITGQDNLTSLVSANYKTLEGLKTSTSEVKQTIDQFNVDFNDTLSGMQSSFTFHRADQDDPEAYITIQTKNIDNAAVGKVYSRIGSETYQFRKSSNNEEVFTIDTDGTTGRRTDVIGQVGIGSGSVANYTEQWAIRKGSNQSSNGSYYDLQIVWVGGDEPSQL